MKRAFDLVIALAMLPLALPLIALAYIAVRLETEGPGFFVQTRVGRGQKPFSCIKMRSMGVKTANVPTHEMTKADVTAVGRFLRASKIDELPQLWNVFTGEMSLVGPRPCLPSQHELIKAREARGVYALRPGITGLAQVNGIDMSEPARLAEIDALYKKRQNLWLDLRLMLDTVMPKRCRSQSL